MIQTQTIDIMYVKKILENCPHYDMIINYEYPYGDILSKKLIDWYRELIFSANGNDENQLMLIRTLDKSLYSYVKDNKYRRELRKILNSDDLNFESKATIKNVIVKLIEFTRGYENTTIRDINVSRWL